MAKGLDNTGIEDAIIELTEPLEDVATGTAEESIEILGSFVERLINECKDELHKKTSHWRALDFEMIHDVLRSEQSVYGNIVAAALAIAERKGARKVVLAEGAKKEIDHIS